MAAAGLAATSAQAANAPIVVTSTADAGDGTLRAAIITANAQDGADEITFASSVTGTIATATALPPVVDALTVTGPGAAVLTVEGDGDDPVVQVGADGPAVTSSLVASGLTLTGGSSGAYATAGSPLTLRDTVVTGNGGQGFQVAGGVLSTVKTGPKPGGRLTLERVQVTDNAGPGGAVQSSGAPVTISDSLLADNVGYSAGGIYALDADVTVTGTTISGGLGQRIGGVAVYDGDLTVTGSTLSANRGIDVVGGLYATDGTTTIANSTIAGNTSSGIGGALVAGSLRLDAATITANAISAQRAAARQVPRARPWGRVAAARRADPAPAAGLTVSRTADVALDSTVIAANGDGAQPDLAAYDPGSGTAKAITVVHSLVQRTAEPLGAGAIRGADPLLGALADHGGPTATALPLRGSPLIDAGDQAGGPTDQRGMPRPIDLPEAANATDGSDIGAAEVSVTADPPLATTPTTVPSGGTPPPPPTDAGTPPATLPAGPTGPSGPTTTTTTSRGKLRVLRVKRLARGLRLQLELPGAGRLRTSGAGTSPTARRWSSGGRKVVTVRLGRTASRRLARKGRLTGTVRLTFTPAGSDRATRTAVKLKLVARHRA